MSKNVLIPFPGQILKLKQQSYGTFWTVLKSCFLYFVPCWLNTVFVSKSVHTYFQNIGMFKTKLRLVIATNVVSVILSNVSKLCIQYRYRGICKILWSIEQVEKAWLLVEIIWCLMFISILFITLAQIYKLIKLLAVYEMYVKLMHNSNWESKIHVDFKK